VARRWVDDPEQVVSFLTVEGRDQVTLRVRIVEMERNIVRQLGVNLSGQNNFGDFDGPTRVRATNDLGQPLSDQFGDPIFDVYRPGRYQSGTQFGTQNGFGVAGAALGGLVSGTWGIYPAFTIDALTFLVSALFIAQIRYHPSLYL